MIMAGHNVCNALHSGNTVMNVTDIVPPCSSLYRRTETEASNLCFKNALQAIRTTGPFRRAMFQTKCKQESFLGDCSNSIWDELQKDFYMKKSLASPKCVYLRLKHKCCSYRMLVWVRF